jgi:hypothetical protein
MTAIPPESAVMSSGEQSRNVAGHLYIQTNERDNSVVHYVRAVDGRTTEVERSALQSASASTFRRRGVGRSRVANPDRQPREHR